MFNLDSTHQYKMKTNNGGIIGILFYESHKNYPYVLFSNSSERYRLFVAGR